MSAWWTVSVCLGVVGTALLGAGCDTKTAASKEGVVAPGGMSNDQQKQYSDQMGKMRKGGPSGPSGMPGGGMPSGTGGPSGMPYSPPSGPK